MKRTAALLLLLILASAALGKITTGGSIAPDGTTEVACDLPASLRLKNTGGRDGAGLCVFTSIGHSSRFQNVPLLKDFQAYMKQFPGGGYPEKVRKYVEKLASEKGQKPPDMLHIEGNDLDLLHVAVRTGRMPSVTYGGRDPHYRGSIAHMVNLVHLDDTQAAVLDNNFIGENDLVWMSVEEFKDRYARPGGGWSVILLAAPPMPPPRN